MIKEVTMSNIKDYSPMDNAFNGLIEDLNRDFDFELAMCQQMIDWYEYRELLGHECKLGRQRAKKHHAEASRISKKIDLFLNVCKN